MTDRIPTGCEDRGGGTARGAVRIKPELSKSADGGRPRQRRSAWRWALAQALAIASAGGSPALAQAPASAPQEIAVLQDPNAIPLRAAAAGLPEQWLQLPGQGRIVRNVINPSLTPFLPARDKANGAAVIVMPGGAFRFLSIDNEGVEVARWLAAHGVAAFLLKYRTVPTSRDAPAFFAALGHTLRQLPGHPDTLPVTPEAIADATAAIRLVRTQAVQFHVDPDKVGMIGFSAGAMTTMTVALGSAKAGRPDFIAPIYGPMDAVVAPQDAPPMFTAIALDDQFFAAGKPLGLIRSWRDAGIPVEVHLYERGGHGFGMEGGSMASRLWIEEFYAWLKDRKIVPSGK